MHDAVPAIAALGVSPIVRLPDMQGWMVKREMPRLSAPIYESEELTRYQAHLTAVLTA